MNENEFLDVPKTVSQAVERLMTIMEPEMKAEVAELAEKDLVNLHYGLGSDIRNGFGLWNDNQELLDDCLRLGRSPLYATEPGEPVAVRIHPDDASMVILRSLWDRLHH